LKLDTTSAWINPWIAISIICDPKENAHSTSRREIWNLRDMHTEPEKTLFFIQWIPNALTIVQIACWIIISSYASWLVPKKPEFREILTNPIFSFGNFAGNFAGSTAGNFAGNVARTTGGPCGSINSTCANRTDDAGADCEAGCHGDHLCTLFQAFCSSCWRRDLTQTVNQIKKVAKRVPAVPLALVRWHTRRSASFHKMRYVRLLVLLRFVCRCWCR
jgi:hypothetical protein